MKKNYKIAKYSFYRKLKLDKAGRLAIKLFNRWKETHKKEIYKHGD